MNKIWYLLVLLISYEQFVISAELDTFASADMHYDIAWADRYLCQLVEIVNANSAIREIRRKYNKVTPEFDASCEPEWIEKQIKEEFSDKPKVRELLARHYFLSFRGTFKKLIADSINPQMRDKWYLDVQVAVIYSLQELLSYCKIVCKHNMMHVNWFGREITIGEIATLAPLKDHLATIKKDLSYFHSMDFSYCGLREFSPLLLAECTNIKYIDLSGNPIERLDPDDFVGLNKLESISLNKEMVRNPEELEKAFKKKNIFISWNE